ncbi:PEPxxWA-CTERM sorting domain-containing protein [Sphingobium sp. CR28]|uniref:PEPxxWA-CTERM sorting domain-containing protein n=1 Tax=Sphingobium sp. CR28 TaxID=3400272 RepID=UPI003FEF753E
MKKGILALTGAIIALSATGAQANGTSPPTVTPQSLTTGGYSQNFNSLASTGGQVDRTLPTGWQIHEVGTGAASSNQNANGHYYAGSSTGQSSAIGAVSYGQNSSDRALGIRASAELPLAYIGAIFTNDMGGVIDSLTIGYKGEQWVDGFSRATLNFQYSLDATSLTSGTWTSFSALDFLAPSTTQQGTTTLERLKATFVNGNSAAFSEQLNGVIGGLAIADGGTFGLRWSLDYISTPHLIGDTLFDVSTNDGLAIDDFTLKASLTPTGAVPEPASWAMMIAGFGFVGSALRRRKAAISFA